MADDLDKKMDPEITEEADKAEEVIEEEASVVEAVEEKAEESVKATEVAATAAVGAAAAGAEKAAEKAAAKEAEAAAKAAKKAEEQAAKEAEKLQAAKDKAAAKLEKKNQKRAAQQALYDACPPQYRPVSTSKYFWLGILSFLPFLGFVITLILSIIGRNRNVKNFERAILAYYIIALILTLIAIIVVGVALPSGARETVIESIGTIIGSVHFG